MAEAQHRAEGAEARAEAAAEAAREETSRARADTERERDQLTHAHQAQATALETRITELATERDTAMRQSQEELALARATPSGNAKNCAPPWTPGWPCSRTPAPTCAPAPSTKPTFCAPSSPRPPRTRPGRRRLSPRRARRGTDTTGD